MYNGIIRRKNRLPNRISGYTKGVFVMVKLYDGGVYLVNGETIVTDPAQLESLCGRVVAREEAEKGTLAYSILAAHN